MNIHYHTLPNGLRLVHVHTANQVAWCGLAINAGSRDEREGHYGLAHFVEHTIFKGTTHRRAWHILNRMERVGGELNAYTTKEGTMIYSVFPHEHLPRAIDLLADLVQWSVFPQEELDRERDVVLEEAASYRDTPSDAVYDDFEDLLFGGSELGHNILGQTQRLRTFGTADAQRFTRRFYVPQNMVFFAYGDIHFDRLVRLLEKATSDFPAATPQIPDLELKASTLSPLVGQQIEMDRSTHQAHVMLGNRAYGIHSDRRMALYLLNNILGGPGMNARLNLSLRERRGLVYTVESSMVSYSDTGAWCVYFGCDHHHVSRCLRLVRNELDHLASKRLTPTQLSAAKRQLKGQIGVACDAREGFALSFGKSFLHYGWERDVERLYRNIDSVTADEILTVAQEVFDPSHLTTLIFK